MSENDLSEYILIKEIGELQFFRHPKTGEEIVTAVNYGIESMEVPAPVSLVYKPSESLTKDAVILAGCLPEDLPIKSIEIVKVAKSNGAFIIVGIDRWKAEEIQKKAMRKGVQLEIS